MKCKMIISWTLYATVFLAAVALITGVAIARTGGGVLFGAAGNHSPSGIIDQLDATMLSGGRYRLTNVSLSGTMDQLEATTLHGGRYQLTNTAPDEAQDLGEAQDNTRQESVLASGGGYQLRGLASPRLASPQLTGDGCCCMYVPCIMR